MNSTKEPGQSSFAAPTDRTSSGWIVNALVVVGIFVSIGLIAVSAALNFRIGYRAADTETDAWIYGIGAGLVDVLKALCPFIVGWGLRQKDWIAVIGGSIAFVVFTAYSVTAGMGFAAQHRAFREAERSGAIEERADLRHELTRLEMAAGALGAQRSEAAIGREVEAVLARPVGRNSTVGSASQRCSLERRLTRDACAEVATLLTELEKAKEWADLQPRLEAVRGKLEKLGSAGAAAQGDPQLDTLAGVFKLTDHPVSRENIRTGLVVLVGLIFELGSGLGLYLVTTPWRAERAIARVATNTNPGPMRTAPVPAPHDGAVVRNARRLGDVAEFVDAALTGAETDMSASEVFGAYGDWCRQDAMAPLAEAAFLEAFDQLASEVGIESDVHDGMRSYKGIALMTPK